MTICVIDLLKMINVYHHDSYITVIPLGQTGKRYD